MNNRVFLTNDIYFDFQKTIYDLYQEDFDNNNFYIKKIDIRGKGLENVEELLKEGVNFKELIKKAYEFKRFYGALSKKSDKNFETDFTYFDFIYNI